MPFAVEDVTVRISFRRGLDQRTRHRGRGEGSGRAGTRTGEQGPFLIHRPARRLTDANTTLSVSSSTCN